MTKQIGVGLLGLGTVGSAVARRLIEEWALLGARAGAVPVLRRVAVRDVHRQRDVDLRGAALGDDPEALVDDPAVELVIEVMGGVDRAASLMERALRQGKPVVTANKAAIEAHGLELAALARSGGVSLRYEAAAGAGLPVVALLRDSLGGDRVRALTMIINGTTNVILTAMGAGASMVEALGEARRRGFAEADPSSDVDGDDAASKLVLLARLAFDVAVERPHVEVIGIRGVDPVDVACAAELGCSLKLVASARATLAGGGPAAERGGPAAGGLALRVSPTLVPAGHPLFGVDDAENAVVIESDLAGSMVLRGLGAGGESTASAVVSDVVASVRDPHQPPPLASGAPAPSAGDRGLYLRVALAAVDDAAALVEQALQDRGIDVRASAGLGTAGSAQLAVRTGPASAETLGNAIDTLDSLAAVDAVVATFDSL
ncbi:MAG: homoserine dehydrogenase [Candidatus Dormibacteria bacterium]